MEAANNKSLVLTGNGQLTLQNPTMETLAQGHCRVKVNYAGVCSSDIYRGFDNSAYFYPLIMGHEFAGQVISAAPDVNPDIIGQKVVVFPLLPCFNCNACAQENYAQCADYKYYGSRNHGAFREFIDVKAWNLCPIPAGVALEDAALIEPAAVIIHGLKKLNLFNTRNKTGKMAIIGYGFLSMMLVELIRKFHPQLQLTIIDRNAPKLDAVTDKSIFKYCLTTEKDWEQFINNYSNSFDFVLEMSGHPNSFANSIELAAQASKVLWLSNITNDLILPQKQVSKILRKELTLIGTWNSTYKKAGDDDWQDCLNLIKEKVLLPSKWVSHYVPLSELGNTLEKMYFHKTKKTIFNCVKVVAKIE